MNIANLLPHFKGRDCVADFLQHFVQKRKTDCHSRCFVFANPFLQLLGIFRSTGTENLVDHLVNFSMPKDELDLYLHEWKFLSVSFSMRIPEKVMESIIQEDFFCRQGNNLILVLQRGISYTISEPILVLANALVSPALKVTLELFLGTDGHVTVAAHLWAVLYLLGSSQMLFPLEVSLLVCKTNSIRRCKFCTCTCRPCLALRISSWTRDVRRYRTQFEERDLRVSRARGAEGARGPYQKKTTAEMTGEDCVQ